MIPTGANESGNLDFNSFRRGAVNALIALLDRAPVVGGECLHVVSVLGDEDAFVEVRFDDLKSTEARDDLFQHRFDIGK